MVRTLPPRTIACAGLYHSKHIRAHSYTQGQYDDVKAYTRTIKELTAIRAVTIAITMIHQLITTMKRSTVWIAVLLSVMSFLPSSLQAQVLESGEELTYLVSYLGVRLGTIRMTNEGKLDLNEIGRAHV